MGRWIARLATVAARFEAPTWMLIISIYSGWLALTFWWHSLPIVLVMLAGAWLCAWHMSLQHECIHGHPTRNARINTALASPPLNLWLPFAVYKESHLRHHRDVHLTDPMEDPESTYMSPEAWAKAGLLRRYVHSICNTVAGRMLLGPFRTIGTFWVEQVLLVRQRHAPWRMWLAHATWVGAIVSWLWGVCGINPLAYAALVVYPGTALNMLRSLAEHRAAEQPDDRTAVVETAGLLGVLFLNNNLHLLHHERPGVPWYALPGQWRSARVKLLAKCHGPVYRNYREVVGLYALRPQHPGPHPLHKTAA